MNRPLDRPSPLRRPLVAVAALVVAAAAGAEELTRWGSGGSPSPAVHDEESLPAALRAVGRHDRVPSEPGGYVDVWGPLAPWEARVLEGRRAPQAGG